MLSAQNVGTGIYYIGRLCNNAAYQVFKTTVNCKMKDNYDDYQIDSIDKSLLQLLQRDALTSTEDLGEAVSLSPTAAKRRVNKMRQGGTIQRDVSIVDPASLGYEVFTLVFVDLERDRRDIVQDFKRSITENPRILQAFYTTGDTDFMLLVVSRSLADYEQFTQSFFWESPHIKSFKTMVVMENVKLGFEIPIDV
jgi:Lrp/AsnC family leucine-responsive transcriptional regulator